MSLLVLGEKALPYRQDSRFASSARRMGLPGKSLRVRNPPEKAMQICTWLLGRPSSPEFNPQASKSATGTKQWVTAHVDAWHCHLCRRPSCLEGSCSSPLWAPIVFKWEFSHPEPAWVLAWYTAHLQENSKSKCVSIRCAVVESWGALGNEGLLGGRGGGDQRFFTTNQTLPLLALTVTRSFWPWHHRITGGGVWGGVEKALIFRWPEKGRAACPLDAPTLFQPEPSASVYTRRRCRLQSRQGR